MRDFLPTQSNRTDGGNGGGIVDRTASPVKCTICENLATCPQFANCGHLFCYYCVKVRATQCSSRFTPLSMQKKKHKHARTHAHAQFEFCLLAVDLVHCAVFVRCADGVLDLLHFGTQ